MVDASHRRAGVVIAILAGAAAALVVGLAVPVTPLPGRALVEAPPHRRPPPTRLFAVLASLALGLLSAPLALVVPAAVVGRRHLTARRAARQHARAIITGLPDAVDLLLLGVGAGLSLPLAHAVIAPRLRSPVGDALREADREAAAGRPRADALAGALAPLGDRARALAHVLVDHLRYGVALGPGLDRLGLELRLDRRRAAEHRARRVPVRLLAPLVTCTLPAFALLTVVPLLAASLRALPT